MKSLKLPKPKVIIRSPVRLHVIGVLAIDEADLENVTKPATIQYLFTFSDEGKRKVHAMTGERLGDTEPLSMLIEANVI